MLFEQVFVVFELETYHFLSSTSNIFEVTKMIFEMVYGMMDFNHTITIVIYRLKLCSDVNYHVLIRAYIIIKSVINIGF